MRRRVRVVLSGYARVEAETAEEAEALVRQRLQGTLIGQELELHDEGPAENVKLEPENVVQHFIATYKPRNT